MKIIFGINSELIVAEIWFIGNQLHYIDVNGDCDCMLISAVKSIVHIEGGLPD